MPCNPPKTNADRKWLHEEYYHGERDDENRKHGQGSHHWTGAESIEWYEGHMLRDTMHGDGDYRWRYLGADHLATTYEGRFYNNSMHGYGFISYPDGRVFNGLWYKNIRWGPGVESHACLREDVGLWYGYQLIRLAWRPAVPSVAIDLVSNRIGFNIVALHRILLTTNVKILGAVNSALELLKQCGSEPVAAADNWKKLYPKNCTDISSQMCDVEAFDKAYYGNQINMLNEVTAAAPNKDNIVSSNENVTDKTTYYAWNNNKIIIHMMKHCFTHEEQRDKTRVNLRNILSGSRSRFKKAGKHELDCRTLIMTSYLGHISHVAHLINECDVLPEVTDVQGNSVMMYAACGDQPEIIHFLVEAGAEIDAYNDACCTPLGVTLLRYALEKRGVACNAMLQALLPPSTTVQPPLPDEKILEWNININSDLPSAAASKLNKTQSKLNNKLPATKKTSAKELPITKKKSEATSKTELQKMIDPITNANADTSAEDKRVHDNINTEYLLKVAEAFSVLSDVNPIPYIFEVNDMCKEVELFNEEETKKGSDKHVKKTLSKKGLTKPSRDMIWKDKEDNASIDAIEQKKQEKMSRIMSTILQLLSEGADPRKVQCPHPALFIANKAGCAELIRHLVKHGVDLNEVYPQAYGYSTLDLAVSEPLTYDNLEIVRTLLECGAKADHRLKVPEPPSSPRGPPPEINKVEGPTLLHAVLAKKIDFDPDNTYLTELRDELLELLLQYGCNPMTQYRGRSAVEVAMNKNMNLFDIFIKSPRTDLNAVINDSNQTILVKMFYLPFFKTIPLAEKLQTLTNLMLFGADPLLKCRNGNDEYRNLFVFARMILIELEASRTTATVKVGSKKSKSELKQKKGDKSPPKPAEPPAKSTRAKSKEQPGTQQPGKTDDFGDYIQALDLVVECARLLYIRWLQAQLMKELIEIVFKYKHRSWTMILKEHKNKKCTSLWLTAVRSLEIWDALKTTKKKIYNDENILKQVACIIHFYFKRANILRYSHITKNLLFPSITYQEKELIESEVANFMYEHKLATMSAPDMTPPLRPYVTPELTLKEVEKYNVCFECVMPLEDAKIPCDSCNLIAFCSLECMKTNIVRINCHPCSSYLKNKYFPTEETETNSEGT